MFKTVVNGNAKTYRKCSYSKEAIEEKCENALTGNNKKEDAISDFYKLKEINYLSSTHDGKYLCNEVICEWLLGKQRIEHFNNIIQITRNNSYIVGHDGSQGNPESGRIEEIIAKTKLFGNKYDYIGDIGT